MGTCSTSLAVGNAQHGHGCYSSNLKVYHGFANNFLSYGEVSGNDHTKLGDAPPAFVKGLKYIPELEFPAAKAELSTVVTSPFFPACHSFGFPCFLLKKRPYQWMARAIFQECGLKLHHIQRPIQPETCRSCCFQSICTHSC